MDFSKNLIRACKEKGLTISQLSRLSGVKQPTLHGWTTGRSVHNLDDLKKVCIILEVSVHKLLFGSPDPLEAKSLTLDKILTGEFQVTIHRIVKNKTT